MSAKLTSAFNIGAAVRNTGIAQSRNMGATVMYIAVPEDKKFTQSDLDDFEAAITAMLHAPQKDRAYPLFGYAFPVEDLTAGKADNVTETMANGNIKFIRYSFMDETLITSYGSIPYAKRLRSFLECGLSLIKVDGSGNVLLRKNEDGTWSGLKTKTWIPNTPDPADFKAVSKMGLRTVIHPDEVVVYGDIRLGGQPLLDLIGLKDIALSSAAAATTTKLKIAVKTVDSDIDLVDLLGADLAQVSNFVVTNKATGAGITPSAAGIVSGHIELTGTYTTGTVVNVTMSSSDTLFTNGVEGYEGTVSVDITIP